MIYRIIDTVTGILAFFLAYHGIGASIEFSLIFAAIIYLAERYDSINRGN